MKSFQHYILLIFFLLLLSVPMYWLSSGGSASQESVVEARDLAAFQPASNPNLSRAIGFFKDGNYLEAGKILLDLYTSASFVAKFERATSDQFPLRMQIIKFSKALDRIIIKTAYQFSKDMVIPADMTSEIYFDKENNQLIFSTSLFNKTIQNQIDERRINYQELIQAHPEIHFYLYYHQTLENSKHHPLTQYFQEADKGQSIAYFEQHLPDGLIIDKFMLNGMDDHLQNYYRTDHHWNVYGILHAYEGIHNLLSLNYPEIPPLLKIENIRKFPEIEFLGLLARRTFYPLKGDNFAVEVVDFPPYSLTVNGQEIESSLREKYFNGNYSNVPYTNHYNEFYGFVTNLTHYSFENNLDRNLLIIGSSYRYALDPLVASHYKNTYCVDLRYYTDFSLSNFLQTHDVDDILIIGDDEVAFKDTEYWKINP